MRIATRETDYAQRVPMARCGVCGTTTKERKPFCSTHVLCMDSAARLAAQIASVEAEVERVSRLGTKAVDLNGLIVEEILDALDGNQMTFRRLVKDHVAFLNRVEHATADHYMNALVAERLISVSLNKRKCEVVALTAKGKRRVAGDI